MRYRFEGALDWCEYVYGTALYPGSYSRGIELQERLEAPVYIDYVPGGCFFYLETGRVKVIPNHNPYPVASVQIDNSELLKRIEALEAENELLKDALLDKGAV